MTVQAKNLCRFPDGLEGQCKQYLMSKLFELKKRPMSFKDALRSRGWVERIDGQMEKGGLTLKESAEIFTELLSDSCSAGREAVTHDRETEKLIEVIRYSEEEKT